MGHPRRDGRGRRHCTTNALIVQFHDEILAHRGEVPNFASFLRVTCMRYLQRRLREAESPAVPERPAAAQLSTVRPLPGARAA